MIDILRQFLESRLREQSGIEKSQTSIERNILVQWVRKEGVSGIILDNLSYLSSKNEGCDTILEPSHQGSSKKGLQNIL